MRLPVEVLVVACLVVGIVPALTVGPYLHTAAVSVLGPATPDYSLALWHGVNAPLVMSVVGAGRRHRALRAARPTGCRAARRGRRCCGGSRASASSSAASSPSRGAGRGRSTALAGTERLQPQLRILVLVALAGGRPGRLWDAGLLRGEAWATDARSDLRPGLAGRRRLRRRRRLAGEVPPLRRAGAARRRRPRHLHDLRLVLRARPRGHPAPGRDRHHGAAAARPALAAEAARGDRAATSSCPRACAAARPRDRDRLRRRRRRHRLCGDDPAAGQRDRRLLPARTPMPRAAAPTSST